MEANEPCILYGFSSMYCVSKNTLRQSIWLPKDSIPWNYLENKTGYVNLYLTRSTLPIFPLVSSAWVCIYVCNDGCSAGWDRP